MDKVTFDDKKYINEQQKELSLKEKIDELYNLNKSSKNSRRKKIKIPRKAKVRKRKLKQGFIGIIYIDENGNLRGDKEKVEGGCFKEKGAIAGYHSTDGREILFWEGKYPVIIQPTWRENPINVRSIVTKVETQEGSGKYEYIVDEEHGQKYIMARMLADVIKIKKKGGGLSIILIIALIVAGYFGYTMFFGGG